MGVVRVCVCACFAVTRKKVRLWENAAEKDDERPQ